MDDAAIIKLFFARDERAIFETRAKYGGYCRSIANNLLCSPRDSEECLSDALHAAWESIPPESPQNLRVYLGRIVRNAAVSRYRSEHAKKRSLPSGSVLAELNERFPTENTVDAAMDARELAGYINEWLSGLSSDDRALFVLRYWHGYGAAELAERTGKTPEKVSQTLYRLKKKLKNHLTERGVII